jgi:hypothetical protein
LGGTAIAPFAGIGAGFNIGLNLDGWNSSVYIQDQGNIGIGTGAYVGAGLTGSISQADAPTTGFDYQKYGEADIAYLAGLGASLTGSPCGGVDFAGMKGLPAGKFELPAIGAGAFFGYAGTATAVSPSLGSVADLVNSVIVSALGAADRVVFPQISH